MLPQAKKMSGSRDRVSPEDIPHWLDGRAFWSVEYESDEQLRASSH